MPRTEVVRHQRARIHGAMIEAVAEHGYDDTSVKQVIALAGVSRRSFYEQFANKQESFLATFDLLVHKEARSALDAFATAGGGLEDRLRASFASLDRHTREEPKPAILVLVEAQTAGVAGTLRVCKATTMCEQMLSRSFAEAPGAAALPAPIVRGITGGLHGAVSQVVRTHALNEHPELTEEMLRWTMQFQTPTVTQMSKRMTAQLGKRMREISCASAHAARAAPAPRGGARKRLLHNMLRLAAAHDYRELTAPQIADEAGVPIDAFLEHFADRDRCFLDALNMIGADLLEIAANPDPSAGDWPRAVRSTVRQLLDYLAERPLYARTIAQSAYFAGPNAVARDLELARELAALLTADAPSAPLVSNALDAVDGVACAIWHTIRCQVVADRTQLLGALSDYVSFIVLTPFIGADAAIEIVAEGSPL
jgi:AcrR family transcriptional regulator